MQVTYQPVSSIQQHNEALASIAVHPIKCDYVFPLGEKKYNNNLKAISTEFMFVNEFTRPVIEGYT